MICYFDGKFTEEENLKFIKMEQIGLFLFRLYNIRCLI